MHNIYIHVIDWQDMPTLAEEMFQVRCHNMEIDEAILRNQANRAIDNELKLKH